MEIKQEFEVKREHTERVQGEGEGSLANRIHVDKGVATKMGYGEEFCQDYEAGCSIILNGIARLEKSRLEGSSEKREKKRAGKESAPSSKKVKTTKTSCDGAMPSLPTQTTPGKPGGVGTPVVGAPGMVETLTLPPAPSLGIPSTPHPNLVVGIPRSTLDVGLAAP